MSGWVILLNNLSVSLFGSILSASFCDALNTRRKRRIFAGCMVALPLLQWLAGSVWPTEFLRRMYPLLVHLPLFVILTAMTKKRILPLISVLAAYLCCQLRRWFALLLTAALDGGAVLQAAIELAVTLPLLLGLLRFVGPAVRRLGHQPVKIQVQYGVIPAMYYAFDYVTVVYTDLLVSGALVALEFMPFVCCMAWLAFLNHSSAVEQQHNELQQIQKGLEMQVRQSVREISALRESQSLARQYRHDIRHHLQYVSACIENGQEAQAQEYISGICQEIEAQRVQRYCENEAANLILSSFAGRAVKVGITFEVRGSLPAILAVADGDLCVILSNALENAIHACLPLLEKGRECAIEVKLYEKEGKLFLQVMNPCDGEVRFENGLPVSDRPGHGVGVQSICAVVKRYGGVQSFLVQDGHFILRLSI